MAALTIRGTVLCKPGGPAAAGMRLEVLVVALGRSEPRGTTVIAADGSFAITVDLQPPPWIVATTHAASLFLSVSDGKSEAMLLPGLWCESLAGKAELAVACVLNPRRLEVVTLAAAPTVSPPMATTLPEAPAKTALETSPETAAWLAASATEMIAAQTQALVPVRDVLAAWTANRQFTGGVLCP